MRAELNQWLAEAAKKLELRRKRGRSMHVLYMFTVWLISRLAGITAVVCGAIGLFLPPFILWAVIAGAVWFGLGFVPKPKERYIKHVKQDIIPKIFEKFFPHLKYDPEGANFESIKKSGLFSSKLFASHTRFYGEDLVEGSVKEVDVLFQEVYFYKREINWIKTIRNVFLFIIFLPFLIYLWIESEGDDLSDSESDDGILVREEINFYKGLYLQADFHKDFKGFVAMFPKALSKRGDRFGAFAKGDGMEPIRIENAELDATYQVWASDPQLGFYVLSPQLIESIAKIKSSENAMPILLLKDGMLYMTIPWDKDYFSVSLKQKIKGPEYFSKYLNEINSFQMIIEHLDLDKRIWSKV